MEIVSVISQLRAKLPNALSPIRWVYDARNDRAYTSPRMVYETRGVFSHADPAWHHAHLVGANGISHNDAVYGWVSHKTGKSEYYNNYGYRTEVDPEKMNAAVREAFAYSWPELLDDMYQDPIPYQKSSAWKESAIRKEAMGYRFVWVDGVLELGSNHGLQHHIHMIQDMMIRGLFTGKPKSWVTGFYQSSDFHGPMADSIKVIEREGETPSDEELLRMCQAKLGRTSHVAAGGWQKWIFDPETGEFHTWQGAQPHWVIAKMVWGEKAELPSWWGGSISPTGRADVVWFPYPQYLNKDIAVEHMPQLLREHLSIGNTREAGQYAHIDDWRQGQTRFVYYPAKHMLFAFPFHDYEYTNHMQIMTAVQETYGDLGDWNEGGFVDDQGQVSLPYGKAVISDKDGLLNALHVYNMTGYSQPL